MGVYVTFYLLENQGTREKKKEVVFCRKGSRKQLLSTPFIFLSLLSLCHFFSKAISSKSSSNTQVILENQATINM
jgi:hypothetical protein